MPPVANDVPDHVESEDGGEHVAHDAEGRIAEEVGLEAGGDDQRGSDDEEPMMTPREMRLAATFTASS